MSDLNVALIIEAIDKATAPLRKVAEGFRRSTGHIKRSMGDAQVAAERFHKAMERATYLRVAADGAARVGQGFTRALRKPVSAAVEFESAMADVRKVVNFEAPDGLEKLGDELRNLSRTIPVSAKGLAEIAAAGAALLIQSLAKPMHFLMGQGQLGAHLAGGPGGVLHLPA